MPGVEEPSDRLLDGVVDLLATSGYEGLSIRKVAAQAGVSIGAVQHHFATKDALLAAAMGRVSARFQARLIARVPEGAAPAVVLREVADELLGAGEGARPASVVWLVRLARSAVHEPTALAHRTEWRQVEDLLASLILDARSDLGAAAARDEATTLLAVLDGLAAAVAVEPGRVPPDRARELLRRHLERVLGER